MANDLLKQIESVQFIDPEDARHSLPFLMTALISFTEISFGSEVIARAQLFWLEMHDDEVTELLPAEAGRLAEIVNYGLKSFAHDLVTRKLSPPSSGSVPSCWRMYSWMTSSVTLPLDATK